MNLYNEFLEIHRDERNFYYDNKLGVNPIKSPHRSWLFIKRYFRSGKKDKAFEIRFHNEFLHGGKHVHTVSMYYLGILLKGIIKPNEDSLVCRIGDAYYYPFTYIWFLTCLYHDTASVVEKNKDLVGKSMNELFGALGIEYNVYDFLDEWGVDRLYSPELIESYYKYKNDKRKEIDHGIVGGYLLFDRLLKNYNRSWDLHQKIKEPWETREQFVHKQRFWEESQLHVFAYISQAIISHNIWYQTDPEIVKAYNFQRIEERPDNRISMDENPLVFFLGILDTIEPTKKICDFDPREVWYGIEIEYCSIENTIHCSILDQRFIGLEWFEKIESLEDWLELKVEKISDVKLVITL